MAKGKSKGASSSGGDDYVLADGEQLHLRNRYLAAFLAWLVPGAGHFYQRRYFKSAIFSISIFTTFLIGFSVANMRCVYASWNTTEKRWQYVLQAGIGLPAMPAALQAWSAKDGNTPMLGKTFMVGPSHTSDLDRWNSETASGFDMGTLYTMIAGLLNILVVFDAYAGPLPPPSPRPKKDDPSDPDDDSTSSEATDKPKPKKSGRS